MEFVQAGKNLTKIIVNNLRSFENRDYEQIYEKISEVRRNQKSQYVLTLRIKDTHNHASICFKTGKWIKMFVPCPDSYDSGK